MAFSSLASNQLVSFNEMQSSGIPLKPGQSGSSSLEIMTKSDATTRYDLNTNNPTLAPKSSNQCVAKRDLDAIAVCGGTTYPYYFGDMVKMSASAGKVSYTLTGLSASESVNIVYNSNIIGVAVANGSGTATGTFYFPYDGSNTSVTFDSTLY